MKWPLPTLWKETLAVRYFGLSKIPLIWFTRPKVHRLDLDACIIGLALTRRNKNHLGSLYFGTMAVGADLACGLLAMHLIRQCPYRISLVFKDMHANFLKRVDANAVFVCQDGERIQNLIEEVHRSGERQHISTRVQVYAPGKYNDEVLAEYSLTLSLKEQR